MAFESLLFSHFKETTGTFSVFLFCSSNKPFVPDTSDTKIFSQKGLSFTPSYLRIYEDGNNVLRDVKEVNNMAESIFTADEQYPGSGCGGGEQRSDLRIRYRRRGAISAAPSLSPGLDIGRDTRYA